MSISPHQDNTRLLVLVGGFKHVLNSFAPWTTSLEHIRRAGYEPSHFRVVKVKSAGGFRPHYTSIASEIIGISTTGPFDRDLTRLPFRTIPRRPWPFDVGLEAPWADGEPVVTTDATS